MPPHFLLLQTYGSGSAPFAVAETSKRHHIMPDLFYFIFSRASCGAHLMRSQLVTTTHGKTIHLLHPDITIITAQPYSRIAAIHVIATCLSIMICWLGVTTLHTATYNWTSPLQWCIPQLRSVLTLPMAASRGTAASPSAGVWAPMPVQHEPLPTDIHEEEVAK